MAKLVIKIPDNISMGELFRAIKKELEHYENYEGLISSLGVLFTMEAERIAEEKG